MSKSQLPRFSTVAFIAAAVLSGLALVLCNQALAGGGMGSAMVDGSMSGFAIVGSLYMIGRGLEFGASRHGAASAVQPGAGSANQAHRAA